MMDQGAPQLAAVVFAPDQPVDAVIRAALSGLEPGPGLLRVAGWLQGREADPACDCSDIVLTPLQGGAKRVITQNLGRLSRGCRLDPAALAEVAGWLAEAIGDRPDLVVLNRFGKSEAEGGGLRAVLEQALMAGVPVLVPVNMRHLDHWRAYAGDMAQELPCDAAAIARWAARLPASGQAQVPAA